MSQMEDVREAIALTIHYGDEPVTFADLFDAYAEDEEIGALLVAAEVYRRAAISVAALINGHLTERLQAKKGTGRATISVGDIILWVGEGSREKCIDTAGFHAWLRGAATENPGIIEKVFNPNDARKGAIPPPVRDTFFEKQPTGKTELQQAPVQVLEDARAKKGLRTQ